MKKFVERSWHLRIDIDLVKDIINENQDKFICPFQSLDSYLNIYKNDECSVKFFNLHECDYTKEPSKDGELYIRYLMSSMKKVGRLNDYDFLKNNFKKFSIETNEENFVINNNTNNKIKDLLNRLKEIWEFDKSTSNGKICRARIVKLPSNTQMPFHKDETSSKNIRVICPIITNKDCINSFKDSSGNVYNEYLPANGCFYMFDEKIEHAVFNNSTEDRYALIFTVLSVNSLKYWDREYYKNQIFWKNWGRL
jgi:hypothetical protein